MTDYLELLRLLAPETILVLTALAVLSVDLFWLEGETPARRARVATTVSLVGVLGSMAWLVFDPANIVYGNGMFVTSPLTQILKIGLLALTGFTLMSSASSLFTRHVGEYAAIVLFASIGMMFMVSTDHILLIFLSLEMTSLSLYLLTAFNKRNPRSAEAAIKYFLFGGVSAAFTLFGLSLIYGFTGEATLSEIAAALADRDWDILLTAAVVMVVTGFGFKVAAAPFHLWAPDAYDGAPTPSAALIASGSKVAGFYLLARVMMIGFAGGEGSAGWSEFAIGWTPIIAVIALASMVFGNLTAIVQANVKRLLAYSAIAHGGYALLAVLANSEDGMSSLIFYVLTYGLTAVGAFTVVSIVEGENGEADLRRFAGMSRRAPLVSFCMLVFMLSLAGIPPLAGFLGKFYVFAAAARGKVDFELLWLVVVGVLMSAVSLYYYLQVLKQIYVAEPADEENAAKISVSAITLCSLILMAAGIVILGCAPDLVIGKLIEAARMSGF